MRRIWVFVVLIFFIVVLFPPGVNASFGVSPADLNLEHLMPGTRVEREFSLSRTDLENDLDVVIEIDVEGVEDWIQVEPGIFFTIPKGERTKKATFSITVPIEAVERRYEGYITIKAMQNSEPSGVSVVKGVAIAVNLITTKVEVVGMLVRNVEIPNVFQGKPIYLILSVENKGNVESSLERVQISVYDNDGNIVYESERSDLELIPPGREGAMFVSFENDLVIGNYEAEVTFYHRGSIVRQDRYAFSVKEALVLDQEIGTNGYNGSIILSTYNRFIAFLKSVYNRVVLIITGI